MSRAKTVCGLWLRALKQLSVCYPRDHTAENKKSS